MFEFGLFGVSEYCFLVTMINKLLPVLTSALTELNFNCLTCVRELCTNVVVLITCNICNLSS